MLAAVVKVDSESAANNLYLAISKPLPSLSSQATSAEVDVGDEVYYVEATVELEDKSPPRTGGHIGFWHRNSRTNVQRRMLAPCRERRSCKVQ